MNNITSFSFAHLPSRRMGFSLVEVLVGMTLFGFVSLGISKGVIWTLQTSKYIELENIIHANIESYISQLKTIDYATLQAVAGDDIDDVDIMNLAQAFVPATPGSTNVQTLEDRMVEQLSTNDWSNHTILYGFRNVNGQEEPKYINLKIKMRISDHADLTVAGSEDQERSFLLVEIEYKWTPMLGNFVIGEKHSTLSCIIVEEDLSPDHLI